MVEERKRIVGGRVAYVAPLSSEPRIVRLIRMRLEVFALSDIQPSSCQPGPHRPSDETAHPPGRGGAYRAC